MKFCAYASKIYPLQVGHKNENATQQSQHANFRLLVTFRLMCDCERVCVREFEATVRARSTHILSKCSRMYEYFI